MSRADMVRIEHLSDDTFAPFAARRGVGVVHFWASWDRTQLWMRQQLELVAKRFDPPIRLAMVDTDTHGDLCRRLPIGNVPTLVYCRDGRLVGCRVGNRRLADIADDVRRVIAGETIAANPWVASVLSEWSDAGRPDLVM